VDSFRVAVGATRSYFGQTQKDVGEGEGVKKTFEVVDMFCGAGANRLG
jgi:hypothetical protein